MKVTDSVPQELSASDIKPEPVKRPGNDLSWEIGVAPKKTISISYKVKIPTLESGKSIKFSAATVAYESEGGLKKTLGWAVELRVG